MGGWVVRFRGQETLCTQHRVAVAGLIGVGSYSGAGGITVRS